MELAVTKNFPGWVFQQSLEPPKSIDHRLLSSLLFIFTHLLKGGGKGQMAAFLLAENVRTDAPTCSHRAVLPREPSAWHKSPR